MRSSGVKHWSQEGDSWRCTKSWAAWAPGLKSALKDALEKFFAMQDSKNLAKVSAGSLQSWKKHYLNDHLPGRRDSRTCVAAAVALGGMMIWSQTWNRPLLM